MEQRRESIVLRRFDITSASAVGIALRPNIDGEHALAQIPLADMDGKPRVLMLWRSPCELKPDVCAAVVRYGLHLLHEERNRTLPLPHWVAMRRLPSKPPTPSAWRSSLSRIVSVYREGVGWVPAGTQNRHEAQYEFSWLGPKVNERGDVLSVDSRPLSMPPAPPGSAQALLVLFPEAAAAVQALQAPWSQH